MIDLVILFYVALLWFVAPVAGLAIAVWAAIDAWKGRGGD